jgi:hypothetical protein
MVRWTSRNGRLNLEMTVAQARESSHPGPCDEDVFALSRQPEIQAQLEQMDPEILRDELLAYGAWKLTELQDHADNLQRILWLAAGDLVESHASKPRRRKPALI